MARRDSCFIVNQHRTGQFLLASTPPQKKPKQCGKYSSPKRAYRQLLTCPSPTVTPPQTKRTEATGENIQPARAGEAVHGGEMDENFISDFDDGPFGCSLSLGFVCLWGWFLNAQVFVEAGCHFCKKRQYGISEKMA